MRGQLGYLAAHGFDVVLISAPGELLDATGTREGVRVRAVPMEREIHPGADVRSLFRMVKAYRAERPEISMVSTPKAGLIAGLAAWVTRVPRRIYMLRGLRLETVSGPKRWLLWLLEWIAMHLAHDVIVVSPSLLARSRELRLLGSRRGTVLGLGASNGVDLQRFAPTLQRLAAGREIRAALGIPADDFVFGFVGRLTVDKGIVELVEAFVQVAKTECSVWLLVIGGPDQRGVPDRVTALLENHGRVKYTGWLTEPDAAYFALDALVLPTYREGFPNAPIEAAAASLPVITTTATGAIDSVVHGVTGLLVSPRDSPALRTAMEMLVGDRAKAKSMGKAGRKFVTENFGNDAVWANLLNFVHKVPLNSRLK